MQVLNLLSLAAERTAHDIGPAAVIQTVTSSCSYYHYLCDGVDDRGWGCGYRTLQSLCSWAENKLQSSPPHIAAASTEGGVVNVAGVPSLRKIQEILVEIGDKPQSFVGSKEWIGSFEACIILDHLFGVASKIVHVSKGHEVVNQVQVLSDHFKLVGSPIMVGGDVDGASKTLIGIATVPDQLQKTSFLIADPHYHGPPDSDRILCENYVAWHGLDLFQDSSFYNFCIPQLPST